MTRLVQSVRLRLRSLFRSRQTDLELDEELQYHLDRQTQEAISKGLSPVDARHAALRDLGGLVHVKEVCRDTREVAFFDSFLRNVRYGLRTMRKSPGVTSVAVITLALGIGANTALFSVIEAALIRPLPYAHPDRLVAVFTKNLRASANPNVLRGAAGAVESGLSISDIQDIRAQSKLISDIAFNTGFSASLTGAGEPRQVQGAMVSPNFFSLLGVSPAFGRTFAPNEDSLAGDKAIVLDYGFWQRNWRGDTTVVGRNIQLDLVSYKVVGISPRGFQTPEGQIPEIYRAVIPAVQPSARGHRFWLATARLKTNDIVAARAELTNIAGRLASQYPSTNLGYSVSITSLKELIPKQLRSALLALMTAVVVLLLIACANIANLLLIRASGRHREIATRQALGAGGSQLIQQFVTENLLISALGGALGLLIAYLAIHVAAPALSGMPWLGESGIDGRVLACSGAATLLCGIFFSVMPILQALRADWNKSLSHSSRSGGSGPKNHRFSNMLVVTQAGLAVFLLIEAGLMLRSFQKLQAVQPGFRPEQVISFQVSMARARARTAEQRTEEFALLTERLRQVPGVESAGAILQLPIAGLDVDSTQVGVVGRPIPEDQEPTSRLHVVTPDYFQTLRIPLIRGRQFNDRDGLNAPGVAIVNEAMARKMWPNENPIGQQIVQRLLLTPGEKPDKTVVGVVGNVKHFGLEFTDEPQLYIPHGQSSWPAMYFVVRTRLELGGIANSLKEAVWSVDRNLPVDKLSTMSAVLTSATLQPKLRAVLLTSFGSTAILLAAIGIYGVASHRVFLRRKEIAIRLALGAAQVPILRMILTDGVSLAVVGALAGCLLARLAAPGVSTLLFGVNAADLPTMGLATALCLIVALLACVVPGRRATRVDPMATLRLD